ICVLPFRDGVSTKRGSFMAAIHHGLPVITTRGPELPEGLVHRENVFLVDYGDEKALTDAILQLLRDEILRRRLAGGAKELANQFGWDNIAEQTVRVYQRVIGLTTFEV